MKSIKQKLVDGSISFYDACKKYYNKLTEEDIDYIVEKDPWGAALHLNNHSFFTQKHVDFIVEKTPLVAACYLNQNPCFTQSHVDFIIEKVAWSATAHMSHMLSEENITYLAENHPEILKEMFK